VVPRVAYPGGEGSRPIGAVFANFHRAALRVVAPASQELDLRPRVDAALVEKFISVI
jgi:hypothetical protein